MQETDWLGTHQATPGVAKRYVSRFLFDAFSADASCSTVKTIHSAVCWVVQRWPSQQLTTSSVATEGSMQLCASKHCI